MIEANELTKLYDGVAVVESISFQVAEGETLGLIGISPFSKSDQVYRACRKIAPCVKARSRRD